jgi:HSP20 family protein
MGFLEKWNPTREMDRFRREFDDLIDRFGFDRDFFGGRERRALEPAIETCIEDGKFIVRTDLPGIDPKDVDIKVAGDLLTIKGSREDRSETKKGDYFRREIRYGAFERAVTLPAGLKADDLKATYRNGVLELSAPMPKEAAPKEVKIQVDGAEPKKVEGESKPKAA